MRLIISVLFLFFSSVAYPVYFLADQALMRYDLKKDRFDVIRKEGMRVLTSYKGKIWCVANDSIFVYEDTYITPTSVREHTAGLPEILWMYNYKYPGFKSYDCAIRVNQKAKGYDSSLNKEAVKSVACKVADWQLREYEKSPFNSGVARGWRNGVLYNGMFDWAETSGEDNYFKFLEKIFDREYWQVGNRMYNADDSCVGQACLDMYSRYKKEYMLTPVLARAEWVIRHKPTGNIDITKGKSERWWWCDALYMAPAVYSRLYAITGKKAFMKFADQEFRATCRHLYDKQEKLFYRYGKRLSLLWIRKGKFAGFNRWGRLPNGSGKE